MPHQVKVYLPTIRAEMPEPDASPLVCIQLNQDWVKLLNGILYFLHWHFLWDGSEAEKIEVSQQVQKLFDMLNGACPMIQDIRVLNGMLQKKECGSDTWVNVGRTSQILGYTNNVLQLDLNFDGTPDASYSTVNNQYNVSSLPATTDYDRICKASWELSRDLCDNFADLINPFALGSNLLASIFQSLLEFLPPTALADDTIEFITQDLPQTIMTWVTSQARDDDIIKEVAELIFCSILENYPDNLDNVINGINLGVYEPVFSTNPIAKITTWDNFSDIADSIYSTLQGKLVAYLVLGFAKHQVKQILDYVGVTTPSEKIIIAAINAAEFFDSRECADFTCFPESCVQVDWNDTQAHTTMVKAFHSTGGYYSIVENGGGNQRFRSLEIICQATGSFRITKIELDYECIGLGQSGTDMANTTIYFQSFIDGVLGDFANDNYSWDSSDGEHTLVAEFDELTEGIGIDAYLGAKNTSPATDPSGQVIFKRLRICYKSEVNPFPNWEVL